MATVSTDFREYLPGQPPADWSPVILSDVDAAVGGGVAAPLDQSYLEVWRASGGISGLKWDVLDGSGAVEMLAKIGPKATATTSSAFLTAVRVAGSQSDESGAFVLLDRSGTAAEFRLRSLSGGFVHFTSDPVTKTFAHGAPFLYRWKVWDDSPGETLSSIRFWALGEDEPDTWDLEDLLIGTGGALPSTGAVAMMADPVRGEVRLYALGVETDL
jgi:hypothetical protein